MLYVQQYVLLMMGENVTRNK